MTKIIVTKPKRELPVITINNDEDADWMHSLPGYKDEVAIHEKLAREHAEVAEKQVAKEIIAKRGDDLYLVMLESGKAVIVNVQTKEVSQPMNKDAFLKFGYWEAYKGEQDTNVLGMV